MKKILLLVVAMAIMFTFAGTQLIPPEENFLHDMEIQEIELQVVIEEFDVVYLENENVLFSYNIQTLDQTERLLTIESQSDYAQSDRQAYMMKNQSIENKALIEYG